MKKAIAFALSLFLILSLCACGGGEKTPDGLQAGYARESIMPEKPVGLSGYGNAETRLSTGFLDYIYTTCIAFTEGEDTILMLMGDLGGLGNAQTQKLREQVSAATGVPTENITFSSSHSHSAPQVGLDPQYDTLFYNAAVNAAKDAMADRAPVTLLGAKTQTEGLAFVRHYLLSDNSYGGVNFGDFNGKQIVDHATPGDKELILIKLDRLSDDKKDILLMNFQCHASLTGSSTATNISADYVGATRERIEQETGMHFAFILGAAGNQNPQSRIPEEDPKNTRETFGAKLAQYAIDALPNLEKIEGEGIKLSQTQFEYACNHYGKEKLFEAKQVVDQSQRLNEDAATALAKQYGFAGLADAKGIVASASNPDSDTMELNTLYVAGLTFVTVPWEMFSDIGTYIKENSPFPYTVVCSMTNGRFGYLPSKAAFDYRCFESYNAQFAAGGAEAAADQLITMLKDFQ